MYEVAVESRCLRARQMTDVERVARNTKIKELLRFGYSHKDIARQVKTTATIVASVKALYFKGIHFKRIRKGRTHKVGYELNLVGCKLFVINMCRTAIRDYYKKKLSAKDLNRIGRYFDLHGLAKAARKRKTCIRHTT